MPNSRQHVNTASPDVNIGSSKLNIVDPSVNTASSYDQDSPKDMFTMGASHTLEATHVEFFSDEDEPKVDLGNITNSYIVPTTPNIRIHKDRPIKNVIGDVKSSVQKKRMTKPTSEQGFLSAVYEQKTHDTLNTCLYACFLSQIEPTSITKALSDSSCVEAMQEELLQFKLQQEEVYVTQPPGFKDPDHLDKVYNMVKDKYVAEILKKFNYTDVKSASTPVDLVKPLVKDGDADDVDVHLYRYMIGSLMYLTASRPNKHVAVCVCARFQRMSTPTQYLCDYWSGWVRLPRGGRGRRPREGNDERVEDLNGQGNDQGLGANGGVEGVNGNVEGANGGAPDIGNVLVNGHQIHMASREVAVSMSWNDFGEFVQHLGTPESRMIVRYVQALLYNHGWWQQRRPKDYEEGCALTMRL
ncbi:hypothetical protein Tco_0127361 [Tanacetum coccineum]